MVEDSIFVRRLQSAIQQKTAMMNATENPECNPILCLFYDETNVKGTQKLLLSCTIL